jgi:hypothetical protein
VERSLLLCGCLVAAAAFSACAVELSPTDFENQTQDAGISTDAGGSADGIGQGIESMNGSWLLIHEQSNCVETLGIISEALSVSATLVNAVQDSAQVVENREICSINLTRVLGLDTTFPNVAAQAHNTNVIEDSVVSSVGVGGGYASGIEEQIYGVNLDNPLVDPMPEDAEDPRVFDADGDGQPGVTLLINGGQETGGCDMYIAQRAAIRYLGTFVRPNLIRGNSVTYYAQTVLGATQNLCVTPRVVTPNDTFSKFEMLRIDGAGGSVNLDDNGDGTVSCDEVNANLGELWTFREPDNTLCGGEN